MALAEVKQLPDQNVQDIPRGLRALADKIEKGELGDCHNIAWVIDMGAGQVACGLLGPSAGGGPTGYLLFGKGMRALENG